MEFFMKTFFWAILLFFSTGNSFAFTLSNSAAAAFSGDEIKVDVASHTCTNIGMSNQQLLDAAKDAANLFWNTVPTSRLRIKQGGLRSVSALFQTDVICVTGTDCTPTPALVVDSGILISCNTNAGNFSSGGVLSVTVPNNISGRVISGALILINDRADNQFQNKSYSEQVSIIAHEMGHAIGLGHSKVDDSLMYYQSISTRTDLGWDDIDGVSYLYPTEQPIKGCGTISLEDSSRGNGIYNNKKMWHEHSGKKVNIKNMTSEESNWMTILIVLIGILLPIILIKALRFLKVFPKFNYKL